MEQVNTYSVMERVKQEPSLGLDSLKTLNDFFEKERESYDKKILQNLWKERGKSGSHSN